MEFSEDLSGCSVTKEKGNPNGTGATLNVTFVYHKNVKVNTCGNAENRIHTGEN